MNSKLSFSLLAGAVSSIGSLCGKLATIVTLEDNEGETFRLLNNIITVGFLILMILCNIIGWVLFTKALHQLTSSLIATLASATSNYIVSGLFGWLLFKEILSRFWFLGILFVCFGLMLIALNNAEDDNYPSIKDHND